MALWRIERLEVNEGTEVPGTFDIRCDMRDTQSGTLAVAVVNLAQATYINTPASLLAALVTAGYTPNDWGGV